MRHVVIGDVGGHLDTLLSELTRLGVDPHTATIPTDLSIVQVGDLIHRGPDSEEIIALVGRLMEANPGRWTQLAGNHEAQYLRPPVFKWRDWICPAAADALRNWWACGLLKVAAAIPTAGRDILVTHAGLTEGFWRTDLGCPMTAVEAAALLNQAARDNSACLFRPGVMLTGRVDLTAGPLWAEAGRELITSWEGNQMPFSQIHGHSSLIDWDGGAWRAHKEIVARTLLDLAACHETTLMASGFIIGIDPQHGATPRQRWHAWELPTTPQ
ncbi:metallophosphoesterase [Dermatophilus congolensis]|uniref:metallophosphoesterase n=1 Tax=Dermatophilus congolensis TaxID=1863 RepID=UPI001AAF6B44|nr:metallophosphoesterase [Dermatophilus congolensis]MBO3142024.1 hypothetical protein [Dermatophilus congolensis]MBO3151015.1 hypothetical protein [Dermatophilus congolensis]MBO3161980.1 hypothetical protein [Dermatophilus congolensis]MBO3162299.1 hypothetical protein [Dermatophilus congolensis]MBO3175853.1 hypothetical protein [Dermatophilus congolensis]